MNLYLSAKLSLVSFECQGRLEPIEDRTLFLKIYGVAKVTTTVELGIVANMLIKVGCNRNVYYLKLTNELF